jgi:hypothetical protein
MISISAISTNGTPNVFCSFVGCAICRDEERHGIDARSVKDAILGEVHPVIASARRCSLVAENDSSGDA